MRREAPRPKRAAFAFACGGLAVLLWHLPTASPAPGLPESSPVPLGLVRELPRSPAPSGIVPMLDARVAASSASRVVAAFQRAKSRAAQGVPTPAPEVLFSSAPPSTVSELPSTQVERAPDGLPVSAMRCTRTAEGLDCGSCRVDGDCPPGRGCVANRETRRFECLASECEEDAHCFPGSVCRAVTTGSTGTVIRRCVPEGQRDEGQSCDSLPVSASGSCREGLRCVNQVCSAPCSLDGSGSCPSGFVCTGGLDGPGCFPDCQRLGCPDGQRCTRVRDNHFQCLVASQGDCRDTPCPQGERCNMRMSRGRAVFWCAQVCNPLVSHSCPEGQVCGVGSPTVSTCFRKCDPMDSSSCGPGWTCATVTEDMSALGCKPDLQR